MSQSPQLLLLLLLPLLGAGLAPLAARRYTRGAALAASLATGAALLLALGMLPMVAGGAVPSLTLPWIPALGLTLALRLDGLALTFVLLVLAIGLLVSVYARYYLPAAAPRGRFHALMLVFQAAMLGLVLAGNLLWLVLCWELTSLLSFLLIAFDPASRAARRGAGIALLVTAGGGIALLAGVLLLGQVVGSYDLDAVLAAGETIRDHPLHGPILVLILLGVFTKSAQFPLHAWLPAAMAAPTPVSAYLHSATLVKAGVFLLARLWPVFSPTELWFPLVGGVGLVTFVFGAYVALFKHDLKGLLAYSTISHLGLMVFLFGLGTPLAAVAGLFHALNHAVFKASLFMAAGIIDHETGTRDMRRLRGLFTCLPITATLALVATGAMAGVPLLNGFLSKEMFFAETLDPPVAAAAPDTLKALLNTLLPGAAVLGGLLSVAYSLRFGHDVFFNGPPIGQCPPREPSWWMRLPVAALVAVCLLVGVLPQQTVAPLLTTASTGMLSAPGDAAAAVPLPEFHLALWQGLTPAVWMSAAALALGMLVYALRRPLFRWHRMYFPRLRAARLYHRSGAALVAHARALLARLGPATLPVSAAWLFATAVAAGAAGWWLGDADTTGPGATDWRSVLPVDVPSLAAALVLASGVSAIARHPDRRLTAVLWTGAVGLVVSLTFAHFSAPDLALTQIAVEVITTLLLLVVLVQLPAVPAGGRMPPGPSAPGAMPGHRLRLALAGAAGVGSAVVAAVALLRPEATIAEWFLEHAAPAAHAANVVNAILVDFRALDTLGEITVLAMAGLGVHLLLAPQAQAETDTGAGTEPPPAPLLLRVLALLVLPAALLLAAHLLLRGHAAPGGGFVAGLVIATALVLDQLAWGVPARPRPRALSLIGAGLGLAWLAAVGPLLLGEDMLASLHWHSRLPLLGEVSLGSTLVFDTGVLLVVTGSLLAVFRRLGVQPAAAGAGGTTGRR
ncbi:hydrogen gas-evolving membrane-bound hydrogenase subunit E [Thiohalocapsa halophila]